MTTYEKIKQLCENEGFSISSIGQMIPGLSVNRASITGWKNGSKPRPDKIKKIADYFNVSVSYFNDNDTSENLMKGIKNLRPVEKQRIPMLGRIACGKPIYAEEEHECYVAAGAKMDADFCLTCQGDSMTGAGIHDGDIVFIKQQEAVDNGRIAAIIIGEEATLKRVYYFPETAKLVLQAENPKYEPLVYTGEELNNIKIIGRAVAYMSAIV